MADDDWHGPRTLGSLFPQQSQRQLQTVGSCPLDRSIEAVGQLLDIPLRHLLVGMRVSTATGILTTPFGMASFRGPIVFTLLPHLLATRLASLLGGFPLSYTLLVPDRTHRKQAVGTRYAPEGPSGEVGKHRSSLEAQPPAQGRGVKDLVVLGHLYP